MSKEWRSFMGLSKSFNGAALTHAPVKKKKEIKPEVVEKKMEIPKESEEERLKKRNGK